MHTRAVVDGFLFGVLLSGQCHKIATVEKAAMRFRLPEWQRCDEYQQRYTL